MATKPKSSRLAPATPSRNPKFAVVRTLTLPVLSLELNVPKYLKIIDKMEISKVAGKAGPDGKPQEPATICHVTDMETGENRTMLVPAVVKGLWTEDYADGAYIGKCFEVIRGPKPVGRRYHTFTVNEVSE